MGDIEPPKFSTKLDSANIVSSGSGDVYVGGSFVPAPTIPVNNSNLPHQPSNFVGRKSDIDRVISALKSRAWIITIDGMGGIGKTTLALQVSHLCKNNTDEYPGLPKFTGFIWTTARDKPNYGLDDVVREVLYVLSPFETNDQSLNQSERLSLAIRALSVEPRLLIIDNFETVEDEALHRFLRDEIPDPSKVLITSRHHIKTGERVVTLGGLEEDEAVELLKLEAERLHIPLREKESTRLQIIARKAYGIPLVLRWVMESVYNGKSLEWVLESLENATADDIFDYIFQRSLALLDIETRRVFRTMTFFPAGARLDAVVAVNHDVPALQERVGQLVSLSLVEDIRCLSEKNRRYQLAPFAKYVATKEFSEEADKQQLIANAINYYLGKLGKLGDVERAADLLFEESDNVKYLIKSAATIPNSELLLLGIQLAQSVSAIDRKRGDKFLEYLLKSTKETDDAEIILQYLSSVRSQYQIGTPVRSPMFFGREKLIDFIRSRFEDDPSATVIFLVGPRRIGKTSILWELASQYTNRCIYVRVDLHALASSDISQENRGILLYYFAREIIWRVQDRGYIVELPDLEKFKTQPFNVFKDTLLDLQTALKDTRIVLMIDELEALFRSVDNSTVDAVQDLLGFFRSLVSSDLLRIITVSAKDPSEFPYSLSTSPFFNIGYTQRVSFLDRTASVNLIQRPTVGLLKYEQGAIERLIFLTGGHPMLLQSLCQIIVDACLKRKEILVDVETVDAAQEEQFQTSSFFFDYLLARGEEDSQQILKIAAEVSNELGEFTEKDLKEELERAEIDTEFYDRTMRKLVNRGIFAAYNQTGYRFTAGSLHEWILHNYPARLIE